MATFFRRRYQRPPESIGKTELAISAAILLLVAALVVFAVLHVRLEHEALFAIAEEEPGATPPVSTVPAIASTQQFPSIELPPWQDPASVDRFAPDELYKKINGHDEAFLSRGVVGLAFARYIDKTDPDHSIDVYWYDMGTPENALEMYRSEAGEGEPIPFGVEGYLVEGAVFFCAGASYVQVMPSSFDEEDAPAALKIGQRIADRIVSGTGGEVGEDG